MNPSTSGWIEKYGSIIHRDSATFLDFNDLYYVLKETGFVYGININIPKFITTEHQLSEDEKAKINLLTALYYTYKLKTKDLDFQSFIEKVLLFYKELNANHISFLGKLLTGNKSSSKLEKLLNARIYIEDNVISKTFNNSITNSLLFIDILLFKRFLKDTDELHKLAFNLEHLAINVTYHALNSKDKNKNDERLAHLFASSLTFINTNEIIFEDTYREKISFKDSVWENRYFLDIACLTVWENSSFDYKSSKFIYGIGKDLGFDKKQISYSLEEITLFFELNSPTIPFLKENNLAMQFYDSMSKLVDKLIIRNRRRLQKELLESKELVSLLSKSTIRDLSPEEKKKVQKQLLDIFKSIPSLAIFFVTRRSRFTPSFY